MSISRGTVLGWERLLGGIEEGSRQWEQFWAGFCQDSGAGQWMGISVSFSGRRES